MYIRRYSIVDSTVWGGDREFFASLVAKYLILEKRPSWCLYHIDP